MLRHPCLMDLARVTVTEAPPAFAAAAPAAGPPAQEVQRQKSALQSSVECVRVPCFGSTHEQRLQRLVLLLPMTRERLQRLVLLLPMTPWRLQKTDRKAEQMM